MQRYETMVISSPNLSEEELGEATAGLEKIVTEGGGALQRTDQWGKRKLAYRIGKHDEGHYTLIVYDAGGEVVRELERRIRIDDRLIRFMTVVVDWEEKVARAEAEKAARAAKGRPPGGAPRGGRRRADESDDDAGDESDDDSDSADSSAREA